ncbi:hypothetical protein QJ850_gp310 [Acanthamoeba polyphaga mimivirus]|uniref:Uncharacterized protein n=1 Tax=Acanthamoeba polyphaga mimivirus Kroon TaxID=3069720 RepID=A0A0G2Y724_9VIRU|nr:hypothetical protein QJ850_gp310 [Acanthamoeba polyphaga mimivirus]AKI80389.1 hypothetical protein [Acanthamoeba polyphaga mimivirus Kroon]
MEENIFVVKFINDDRLYQIPLNIINKYPKNYFQSIIHFTNKFECVIETYTYEEFSDVYKYLTDDNFSMQNYLRIFCVLDYFGLNNIIYDELIQTIKFAENKINLFMSRGIHIFSTTIEEYFAHKRIFSDKSHIIPIQIVKVNSNSNRPKYILFAGNGELVDFGYVNTALSNDMFLKNSFLELTDKIPQGLPFDFIRGVSIHEFKHYLSNNQIESDYYHKFKSYMCINEMTDKTYCNEVQYILNGFDINMNLELRKEYFNKDNFFSCKRSNKNLLSEYMNLYLDKNTITYKNNIMSICKDFLSENKNLLSENIPVVFEDSVRIEYSSEHSTISHTTKMSVSLGFLNIKNFSDK